MSSPLSLVGRKAELSGLRNALSGGAALFYADLPPSQPDESTAALLLATLALPSSAGVISQAQVGSVTFATLTLTTPLTVNAIASGIVGWVRLADSAGNGYLDLLVGLALPAGSTESPAPVIVNARQLYAGGEISLVSCVLAK